MSHKQPKIRDILKKSEPSGRKGRSLREKLIILLSALIYTCLAVIILISLTGGVVINISGVALSMRSYWNPLVFLITLSLARYALTIRKKDILHLFAFLHPGALKNPNFFVIPLFILFLLSGALIHKDYGISIDEPRERFRGAETLKYVRTGNWDIPSWHDPFHGQSFVLVLAAAEKAAGFPEYEYASASSCPAVREIYHFRHFLNFLLFFISSIFFYLLILKVFGSWQPAVAGTLLLILSPRIFGHAFFNPKDLPFMSVFIISIYTLLNYLDRKNFPAARMHAAACGFLIGIRILGLIVPLLTLVFFALDSVFRKNADPKKAYRSLPVYGIFLLFFMVLLWPLLWERPIANLIEAFTQMRMYPWEDHVLYMGQRVLSSSLPRHYLPVWIGVTTPVSYLFFLITGAGFAAALQFKKNENYEKKRNMLILLSWAFLPLIALMMLKPVLYDGWRQAYFIYPGMLAVAVFGIVSIYERLKKTPAILHKKIGFVLAALVIAEVLSVAYFMVKFHPYQHVYFNRVISGGMERAKANFEVDYWGLSTREGLEYLLDNDDRSSIAIFSDLLRAPEINSRMLTRKQRKRLKFLHDFGRLDEADYYITHYREPRRLGALARAGRINLEKEYYSIDINGAKILSVYEIIHNSF